MSKSGTIRMAIGPIKKRLVDNISIALKLVTDDIPSDTATCLQLINKIETATAKLTASIDSLTDRDRQWSDMMLKLDEDGVAIEEKLYNDVAAAATGYIVVLEEGKELANQLVSKQRQIKQVLEAAPSASSLAANNTPSTPLPANRPTTVKLPKIELPTFKGDPTEWPQFWTVFEATVHNTSLTNVEKFSYLIGQLRTPAIDTIGGLPITENGYKVAVDVLKERYHRAPEQLVSNLYGQLKRLPSASGQVKEMRATYDSCEKILRQLKDAHEDVESNRSLVLDIWSKYPEQVLKDMTHRKAINAQSTLTQVQKALKEYINEADSLSDMLHDLQPFHQGNQKSAPKDRSSASQSANYMSSNSWNRSQSNHSPALAVSTGFSDDRTPKSPCYFCNGSHFNSQCDQYVTAEHRRTRLSEVNRCVRCLDSTHLVGECRTRVGRIRCHFCQTVGEHPSPLCPVKFAKSPTTANQALKPSPAANNQHHGPKSESSPSSTSSKPPSVQTPCVLGVEEQAILATAVTTIRNPETGAERSVRVILDNGCPRTFILDSVAKELNLTCSPARNLYISAFGCKRTATHASLQSRFEMQLREGKTMSVDANTVNLIVNRSAQPGKLPEATERLTESMGAAMADPGDNEGPPELLIGSDYFWQLISCNRVTSDDGIYLISSGLGLLLGGRYQATTDSTRTEYPSLMCLTERTGGTHIETSLTSISSVSQSSQRYPDVDEFWDLERIGITDHPIESDDEVAQRQFDDTVKFQDGRYQVCWPWKENQQLLPTNYNLAVGRLRSLAKRLSQSDGNLLQEYEKTLADQLQRGIIELVPPEERVSSLHPVHYLPHHPIVRTAHSTTKVRIVFDASAKCRKDQRSLNECLYRGPVILPDLCSILIRFRLHTVAIVADIEKAFLQLGLQPSQRDVTRFLWFADTTKLDATDNIVTYRFVRVPFGVISSPFLLGGVIQHHLKEVGTVASMKIRDNMYVDNAISGTRSLQEAVAFYDQGKQIFNEANMNLREWCSNSNELLEYIPQSDQSSKRTVKVLGINWHSDSDQLVLQNNWSTQSDCLTKRDVLKAIASVFDPLGLFQPCTLQAKFFLRQLWNDGGGWDDEMNAECRSKWTTIHSDVAPIFEVKLPRKITDIPFDETNINLAIFSDASKDAYAATVYLRVRDDSSQRWVSTLIYAKSRLTPRSLLKSITLPRLELLGLTIGARAAGFVRTSLQCKASLKCFLFCDSVCVLSWLRTDKPLQKFVENRVKEIQTLKDAEYHHVRSEDNPADICTRGLPGRTIAQSSFWWHGPEWLQDDISSWPTNQPIEPVTDSDFVKEVKGAEISISLLAGEALQDNKYPFGIESSAFSSLRKLLRVTAYCLKFVKNTWWDRINVEIQQNSHLSVIINNVSNSAALAAGDINSSQTMWIKSVQQDAFAEVAEALHSHKHHQLIKQLNLGFDEYGVIRCYGRLENAELPANALTPVLLPKTTHLTKLIIEDAHARLFHYGGVSHTLSQVRQQFWVPQGRRVVRGVLKQCVVCRRTNGPPYALPEMPPLPRERVARARPFQFTGLDYLGPVSVAGNDGTTLKMWCCLFTCFTTRAIHLECITDCTAQSFVECLSRFVARRGRPDQILSDNAPQFRLAQSLIERTWKSIMTDDIVTSYIADRGIIWKFTTELAPWQGGMYERLVGIVKSTFKSVIGRRLLKWDAFVTLITETEAIVNSRPLTYINEDIESGHPLRPMDFIVDLPTGTSSVDPGVRPEGGEGGRFLLKFWKAKQKRLDVIWKQWYEEYLLSLRERDQAVHKGPRSAVRGHPVPGEIVIVKNTDVPRGQWKLARVMCLIPSRDGAIRSAQLKLPNAMVVKRPINHLYRLELPVTTEINEVSTNPEDDGEDFLGFDVTEVEEAERVAEAMFAARQDNDRHLALTSRIECVQQRLEDNLSLTLATSSC